MAIVKAIVFYLVLVATGTLVVAMGASFAKSSRLIESVRKSDAYLAQKAPAQAVAVIKEAEHLAPSYPSYFRALHCNEVRAYARLSRFEESMHTAKEIYKWNTSKSEPSSALLPNLALWGDKIVNLYLQIYGSGLNYNKWSGYNALLIELRRTGNLDMLDKVADHMLALDPKSRLARQTNQYVQHRKKIASARSDKERTTEAAKQPATVHSPQKKTKSPTEKTAQTSKKSGIRTDNPYAEQYLKAKKQYVEFYKSVQQLKEKRDSATGKKRVEYADKLQKMKYEGIPLRNQYQNAARRYKQWNRQNPSE